jgi:UDP-N-acetylglucosamine--N-acetylmuramyl-(pentapeptide) pyrophosphoryl-undecaprenol N-acetylglucosamine transferase
VNVAICGGGTGGHLHPLLALAGELQSHEDLRISLFLNRKALSRELPFDGRIIALDVSGLGRDPSLSSLRALFAIPRAFLKARREMKKVDPHVAVAFGGYASVPGALAALTLRTPLILQEQNVIPGLANRMLAPFARVLAVSFEATLERFPRWRRKARVTGNPLYDYGEGVEVEDAFAFFGLQPDRKTVAVLGGSQGAASINRAVLELLELLKDREDIQILHSVGPGKYQEFLAEAAKVNTGRLVYRPFDFIRRMDLLYRCADIVVSRAGASTISELAASGCAAILVPYPFATAAHQDANAEVLAKVGAARVIKDSELDGAGLSRQLLELLGDPEKLAAMGLAAGRMGKPDAASSLARIVIETGRER